MIPPSTRRWMETVQIFSHPSLPPALLFLRSFFPSSSLTCSLGGVMSAPSPPASLPRWKTHSSLHELSPKRFLKVDLNMQTFAGGLPAWGGWGGGKGGFKPAASSISSMAPPLKQDASFSLLLFSLRGRGGDSSCLLMSTSALPPPPGIGLWFFGGSGSCW